MASTNNHWLLNKELVNLKNDKQNSSNIRILFTEPFGEQYMVTTIKWNPVQQFSSKLNLEVFTKNTKAQTYILIMITQKEQHLQWDFPIIICSKIEFTYIIIKTYLVWYQPKFNHTEQPKILFVHSGVVQLPYFYGSTCHRTQIQIFDCWAQSFIYFRITRGLTKRPRTVQI